MLRTSYPTFTDAYYDLVWRIYWNNEYESAPRGMKIKESLFQSFTIENPRNRLLYIPEREFSLSYAVAECVWYNLGTASTAWISNYSKFWENISDNGTDANSGYGARIFKPHPLIADSRLTQWDYVLDELRKDRDSRRAVIHIRTPFDSIPEIATKDVPCTLTLSYFIRDEKLHAITSMRSSDLILGITFDIPFFTLLQEMLANELGVGLGKYMHVSNSLHIYEKHYDMCERILANEEKQDRSQWLEMPQLPKKIDWAMLDHIQAKARASDCAPALSNLEKQACVYALQTGYERDFARVLIAHRLRKLKKDAESAAMLNKLEFKGYKFFDK